MGVVFDWGAGLEVGEGGLGGLVIEGDDGDIVGEGPFDFSVGIAEADETALSAFVGGEEVAEQAIGAGGSPLAVAAAEEDVVVAGGVVSDDGGHGVRVLDPEGLLKPSLSRAPGMIEVLVVYFSSDS